MFPVHLILISACFFTSLLFLKKPSVADISMPVFLVMLFALEQYCYHLKKEHEGNNLEYNLWFPFEFIYYATLITGSVKKPYIKKRLLVLVCIYLTFVIINYLFFQDLKKFSGNSYLYAMVMVLIVSFLKMHELLSQQEIENPFHEPFFWLIIGLITVNLLGVFQFGATDYLYQQHLTIYRALQVLNLYLTYLQYTCLMLYFYTKWKYRR